MNWLIAVVLLGLFLVACWLLRREKAAKEQPDLSMEELAEAAIELHQISRRFDLAFTRHELRTETLQARRELDQELRLLKVLESQSGGADEAAS